MSASPTSRPPKPRKGKGEPGRPPKILELSDEAKKRIIGSFGGFGTKTDAAIMAGVDVKTLTKWLTEGTRVLEEFGSLDAVPRTPRERRLMAQLSHEVQSARHATKMRLQMRGIERALSGQDYLLTYFLTKQFPEEFGDKQTVDLNAGGGPATPEAAAALVRAAFGEHGSKKPEPDAGTGS